MPEKQSRDLTTVKEGHGTKGRLSFLNGTPAVGTAFFFACVESGNDCFNKYVCTNATLGTQH